MPKYDIPICFQIEAETYEQAMEEAELLTKGLQMEEMCYRVDSFEHDNDGQRVLYLHAEENPR